MSIPVLGIDASITACGWATETANGRRAQGVITPTTRGLHRLNEIGRTLARIAAQVEARAVAIEDYPKGMPAYSIIPLAQLGGVIREHLIEAARIPEHRIIEVSPSTLKLWATGNGRATKEQMVAAANDHLDWRGTDHNIADAVALHRLLCHAIGQPYLDIDETDPRYGAVRTITPQVQRAWRDGGLL